MKHVLLTLLVFAASTHVAPGLAEDPADAPEEESLAASSAEALEESPVEADTWTPIYYWICKAVPSPSWPPSWPAPKTYTGIAHERSIAIQLALQKCTFQPPGFLRRCRIASCWSTGHLPPGTYPPPP